MTKGNWERRAERAIIKREEAKERKLKKNQNKIPTIEVILSHLNNNNNNKYKTENEIIKVWLEDITTNNKLCSYWLRNSDCKIKRCHYLHEYSFFGIRNIQLPYIQNNNNNNSNNNESILNEPSLEMKLISELHPDKYSLVRFIAINDICVYDWLYPHVWMEWSNSRIQEIKSRENLKSVHEEEENKNNGHDNDNQDNEDNGNDDVNDVDEENNLTITNLNKLSLTTNINSNSNSSDYISNLSHLLLSNIFHYCSLSDICSLSVCSQSFRNLIRKDQQIRLRKKEFLDIHSKEINKKKKDEKKKKTKNSYLKKQDKKDGFARGGNS